MKRPSDRLLLFSLALCTPFVLLCCDSGGDGTVEQDDGITHVALVGHSHIDLAWKWTWREARQICANTFSSVLKLMDRDDLPEYRYAQSSAQAYLWMEDTEPEIFDRITGKIDTGRWEVVGGMWVESDSNLSSGESLVRQCLYGKRYFLDRFGVDVKVAWLPDSFGYAAILPQIFKGAGMEYFVFTKTNWNDTHRPDTNFFWWEGPDGSRLFSYLTVGSYDDFVTRNNFDGHWRTMKERHPDVNTLPIIIGIGDHGGGVPAFFLKQAARLAGEPAYDVRYTGAEEILEEIRSSGANFPTIDEELYLEYHRGTYTSHADAKENNRGSEILMEEAEKFASFALDTASYPMETMRGLWQKVLFNQFHDILPGSSIPEVYDDSHVDYAEIFSTGGEILDGSLELIASHIDTRLPAHPDAAPLVIFNPLSWPRDEFILIEVDNDSTYQVYDHEGGLIESEQTGSELTFRTDSVPSIGYTVVFVSEEDVSRPDRNPIVRVDADGDLVLENERLLVVIDHETGCLSRVLDKALGLEVLDPGRQGNLLQIYQEANTEFPAWNINYLWGPTRLDNGRIGDLLGIDIVKNGSQEGIVRVSRVDRPGLHKSFYDQYVILRAGDDMVRFRTDVDWNEFCKLLKVGFTFGLDNTALRAFYDVAYTTIERIHDGSIANWEVPAQKWVDLIDDSGTHGMCLLNDRKYGFDLVPGPDSCSLNELRMTLLKSSSSPVNFFINAGGPVTDVG
ncbi:alpha-mannosidase, partial [Thermodesulfobacteriota bacterium]